MLEPVLPFRWPVDVATLASYDDLLGCVAHVLAHAQDGDLYFVGRSPESLHDFLLGLLEATA